MGSHPRLRTRHRNGEVGVQTVHSPLGRSDVHCGKSGLWKHYRRADPRPDGEYGKAVMAFPGRRGRPGKRDDADGRQRGLFRQGGPAVSGCRQIAAIDARPRINGHPWDSPEALALIKNAAGDDAWLEAHEGLERFDIMPLLIATDGAVAMFGRDIRRLRPNILIGGVEGLAETFWSGAHLRIADTLVRLDALRGRCTMTTVDPDTLERDPEVLKDIVRRFGGRLGLDADVARGGTVRVGDDVLIDEQASGRHVVLRQ